MAQHYYEDFEPGQLYTGKKRIRVDADEIKRFAAAWDPQPFHLDEAAAAASVFGGLAASGWHTAAMTMRLFVDGDMKVAGGLIGMGLEELRWPRPVRAGDELRVQVEVLELRPSRSRPSYGLVKVRTTTLNQRDEPVQVAVNTLFVPRRDAGS